MYKRFNVPKRIVAGSANVSWREEGENIFCRFRKLPELSLSAAALAN